MMNITPKEFSKIISIISIPLAIICTILLFSLCIPISASDPVIFSVLSFFSLFFIYNSFMASFFYWINSGCGVTLLLAIPLALLWPAAGYQRYDICIIGFVIPLFILFGLFLNSRTRPYMGPVREKILDVLKAKSQKEVMDVLEFVDYDDAIKHLKKMKYFQFLSSVIKGSKVRENSKVLEICPGFGWIDIWLAKMRPDLDIIGLESSDKVVETARRYIKEEGVDDRVKIIHGDISNINQFEDNYFEIIISNGGINPQESLIDIFNDISRIIKDDGIFYFSLLRRSSGLKQKISTKVLRLATSKYITDQIKKAKKTGLTQQELINILSKSELKDWVVEKHLQELIVRKKNN